MPSKQLICTLVQVLVPKARFTTTQENDMVKTNSVSSSITVLYNKTKECLCIEESAYGQIQSRKTINKHVLLQTVRKGSVSFRKERGCLFLKRFLCKYNFLGVLFSPAVALQAITPLKCQNLKLINRAQTSQQHNAKKSEPYVICLMLFELIYLELQI